MDVFVTGILFLVFIFGLKTSIFRHVYITVKEFRSSILLKQTKISFIMTIMGILTGKNDVGIRILYARSIPIYPIDKKRNLLEQKLLHKSNKSLLIVTYQN